MTPQKYPQNLCTPKILIFLTPPPQKKKKKKKTEKVNNVIQTFKPKKAPRLRMYQTVSEYPPPPHSLVDRDRFVAVNIFTKM